MERKPFIWHDLYYGNFSLFETAVRNPKTIYVYDIDGILADTAKPVFEDFTKSTGIRVKPSDLDSFNYLTRVAEANNLPKPEDANGWEKSWYDPGVLLRAKKYLYIKPVVEKTLNLSGPENNYILTSRNFTLAESTNLWLPREFPRILLENVMIKTGKGMTSSEFKAGCLWWVSKMAPWVVFMDDSTEFIKAALDLGLPNIVAVNIPQGKILPDFTNPNMIVFKRYPEDIQGMYPLMHGFELASQGI